MARAEERARTQTVHWTVCAWRAPGGASPRQERIRSVTGLGARRNQATAMRRQQTPAAAFSPAKKSQAFSRERSMRKSATASARSWLPASAPEVKKRPLMPSAGTPSIL
jgi:hypothetical protein